MTQPLFQRLVYLGLVVFIGFSEITAGQSVTLSVGPAQQGVDGSVVVPINLASSEGAQPTALQWSLSYSSDVTGLAFAPGTEAANADKLLACAGNTCVIYGINTNAISDGTVAFVTLQSSSHASFLIVPIQITGVVAAAANGASISSSGVSGSALLLPTPPFPPPASPTSQTQPALAGSVSPSGGGGLSQIFTFVFSDSQGATNLATAEMLFAVSPGAANACLIVYDPNQGTIALQSDDLASHQIKPIGSSSTLENSQCAIDATSATANSLSISINVGITFKSTFKGRKNIYMYAADGESSANTGWEPRGTYTVAVPDPPLPTAESVTPDGGNHVSQTFGFVFSDSQSAANLEVAAVLFAPVLDVQNSCYVVYDRSLGTIQLEWDNVMGADVKPVNSPVPLQNSQCAIGTASVTTTDHSTIVTLDIIFKSTFKGVENIYMYGADGDGSINTGWVQKGTWTLN